VLFPPPVFNKTMIINEALAAALASSAPLAIPGDPGASAPMATTVAATNAAPLPGATSKLERKGSNMGKGSDAS
jgi:hypothetical protein